MDLHVQFEEARKNLSKYMERARTAPVFIDQGVSTAVLVSKEQFEGLQKSAHRQRGSEGLSAMLDTLAPLDESFPPIPDPSPKPFEL
jgi:PHD/YefM family antitoxin component YafN of YafNO toxin-antitoxin module